MIRYCTVLGNTARLTDSTGAVVEMYTYDVYGKPNILNSESSVLSSSTVGNRFLFTGREYIAEIDLYDYRNRYYSHELGRFLQKDPIGFDAGDVNLYRYVWKNGMNFRGPDGRLGVVAWVVIGGVTFAVTIASGSDSVQNPENSGSLSCTNPGTPRWALGGRPLKSGRENSGIISCGCDKIRCCDEGTQRKRNAFIIRGEPLSAQAEADPKVLEQAACDRLRGALGSGLPSSSPW